MTEWVRGFSCFSLYVTYTLGVLIIDHVSIYIQCPFSDGIYPGGVGSGRSNVWVQVVTTWNYKAPKLYSVTVMAVLRHIWPSIAFLQKLHSHNLSHSLVTLQPCLGFLLCLAQVAQLKSKVAQLRKWLWNHGCESGSAEVDEAGKRTHESHPAEDLRPTLHHPSKKTRNASPGPAWEQEAQSTRWLRGAVGAWNCKDFSLGVFVLWQVIALVSHCFCSHGFFFHLPGVSTSSACWMKELLCLAQPFFFLDRGQEDQLDVFVAKLRPAFGREGQYWRRSDG